MNNKHGFTLPESFLIQLGEYTQGYLLFVCNEAGELYSHETYDNPVIKLGLTNFAHMHINAAQEYMHGIALMTEEEHQHEVDENTDNDTEREDPGF